MRSLLNKENLPTIFAGLASSFLYISLALGSREYGDLGLNHLLIVCTLCALLSFYVWYQHHQDNRQVCVFLLMAFAILFRVIGGTTFPILEDDFYRYLWDGRMTWQTGSPYNLAPSSAFGDESLNERFQLILDGINYPDVTTIYGPTCQWLFALAYLVAPGEVWPLQVILGGVDLGVIAILLKLAKPNSVLLYAWCPLIIKEFVITAHPDVLGVVFLLLALLLHRPQKMLIVGVLMALAAGVKIFALLLLPFVLQFYWRAWLGFIITAIVIALPFGVLQAWLPGGLSAMGSSWLFNAPLYSLLGGWLSITQIKLLLLFALAVFCAIEFWRSVVKALILGGPQSIPLHQRIRGDLLYGALFLCAPAFNAWYLVWLLPFAVLRPSLWAWLASVTILLSYASGINLVNSTLESYAHSAEVLALEFLPPLFAFIAAWWLKPRAQTSS